MARLPYQVLVMPFRYAEGGGIKYALLERRGGRGWGAITGGGEDGDESPLETARRRAHEEASISREYQFMALASFSTWPAEAVAGFLAWGPDVLVIPEYAFAVEVQRAGEIVLSAENTAYEWLDYPLAVRRLRSDSHRNALWELDYRLRRRGQAT